MGFVRFLILALAIIAAPEVEAKSARSDNRIGVQIGLLSHPYPSGWGAVATYSFKDYLRVHAGYGSASPFEELFGLDLTSTSFGFGLTVTVPDWDFSPFYSFSYSHWEVTGSFQLFGTTITLDPGDLVSDVFYNSVGFEWASSFGFVFGIGMHFTLTRAIAIFQSLTPTPGTPFMYLGWAF